MRRILATLALLFPLTIEGQPTFVDRSVSLGVQHVWGLHVELGDLGGGIALFDVDGDFDLDLLLASQAPEQLRAYRNDGSYFSESTADWGLGGLVDIKQILFADFDNDGRSELFLSCWRCPSKLFRWNGQNFEDHSAESGLVEAISPARPGMATGASAGDPDRDGDLDLYLSYWKDGVLGPASANRYYRNDGGLRFTEMAAALGLDDPRKSYQPTFSDFSGDGWPDLLVAHDKGGGISFLQNDGAGTLIDRSEESGLVGRESATNTLIDGMGVAIADYDGDLDLDVYVTNIFTGNVLYRNEGDGSYRERAIQSGTLSQRTAWGTVFLDADQDGWSDLAVANFDHGDEIYMNDRDGTFSARASGALAERSSTLGLATGDLDGDGDLDLVRSRMLGASAILINETPAIGHWVQLQLVGKASNRDGVGARVTVSAQGRSQVAERRAGDSYLSYSSPRLHFGLAAAERFDVLIEWPSGQRDEYSGIEADRLWIATEGESLLLPQQRHGAGNGLTASLLRNPLRPGQTSSIELRIGGLPNGETLTVGVYDVRGRQLLERTLRSDGDPQLSWHWDGSDGDGDALPAGIYRVQLRARDQQISRAVTILR